jgi:hypothetical protein
LSEAFDSLLDGLAPAFGSPGDFTRARTQWPAGLLNLGRHTVTGALSTAGAQHRDWSAQYRLPVDPVFAHVRREALAAADAARLAPVDWQEAPLPKKPSRHADARTQKACAEARKQASINEVAAGRMARLRTATARPIHWVSDGRFTNRTVLRQLPENTVLIGRVRKDTVPCAPCQARPGKKGRPRKYGDTLPAPEQLRAGQTAGWSRVEPGGAGCRPSRRKSATISRSKHWGRCWPVSPEPIPWSG